MTSAPLVYLPFNWKSFYSPHITIGKLPTSLFYESGCKTNYVTSKSKHVHLNIKASA